MQLYLCPAFKDSKLAFIYLSLPVGSVAAAISARMGHFIVAAEV
jgi:gluconate kinase